MDARRGFLKKLYSGNIYSKSLFSGTASDHCSLWLCLSKVSLYSNKDLHFTERLPFFLIRPTITHSKCPTRIQTEVWGRFDVLSPFPHLYLQIFFTRKCWESAPPAPSNSAQASALTARAKTGIFHHICNSHSFWSLSISLFCSSGWLRACHVARSRRGRRRTALIKDLRIRRKDKILPSTNNDISAWVAIYLSFVLLAEINGAFWRLVESGCFIHAVVG